MDQKTNKSHKKTFIGIVVSNKMQKTIVVQVATRRKHPLYHKFITTHKKYKVHDEKNVCGIGDKVQIIECRHLSKEKCWRLGALLEKAKMSEIDKTAAIEQQTEVNTEVES